MLIQSPDNSFHHETFSNKCTHSVNGKSHRVFYNFSCRDTNGEFSMENHYCNNHFSIPNALSKDLSMVNINLKTAKDKTYEISCKYNSNYHLPNAESVGTIGNSAVTDVSVNNLNSGNVIHQNSHSSENYDDPTSKYESFLSFQSSDVTNGNFKENILKSNPKKKLPHDHCPREIHSSANKEKRNALRNHEKCTEVPTHYQS